MRASVRMTRYLESWGAARPFAHLNHRESVSSDSSSSQGRRRKVRSRVVNGNYNYKHNYNYKLLLLSTVWDSKSVVIFVAERLPVPLMFSMHTELRGYLCNISFCQNWTIFRLLISLAYYNLNISLKQNYLFFLSFFHPEILPATCGFVKKR